MSKSIYDISYDVITMFYEQITEDEKRKVFNTLKGVLSNGTCDFEIYKAINQGRNNGSDVFKILQNINSSRENLLRGSQINYHNELKISSSPPVKFFDIEQGTIVTKNPEDFFLEMKSTYTIDDLINYIEKKHIFNHLIRDKSRALGSLKYLLKSYDLDELLFIIDTSVSVLNSQQKRLTNMLQLKEYEILGKENRYAKINELMINDVSIVPKKRVPIKMGDTNIYVQS